MSKIFLVSSTHNEKGLANSSNLLAILNHIEPEVIFLEMPPEHYEHYFLSNAKGYLETETINMYRINKEVKIIPVDSKAPNKNLGKKMEYLFQQIDDNSPSSAIIGEYIHQFTCQYGFPYLNSEKHREHLSAQKEDEKNTINKLNETKLFELYQLWEDRHEQRENDMLKNIQNYCENHSFNIAVFLVGSAHSGSMINKAKNYHNLTNFQLFSFSQEKMANDKHA